MDMTKVMKSWNGLEVYDEAAREMHMGVVVESTDGNAYTATIKGIESLAYGISFVIVPNMDAVGNAITLNVNNLGAVSIKQRLSGGSSATTADLMANWIKQNSPVRVTYVKAGSDDVWIIDAVYPDLGSGVYGTLGVDQGGTGATTASAALNNLGITWGTEEAPATGTAGTIYIQIN